jgi:hypothetical protein
MSRAVIGVLAAAVAWGLHWSQANGAIEAVAATHPPGLMNVMGNGQCSGVQIAPSVVLTARHCVGGLNSGATVAAAGGRNVGGRVSGVHEELDVALLCTASTGALPARMRSSGPGAGADVTIAGHSTGPWSDVRVTGSAPAGQTFLVQQTPRSTRRQLPCFADSGGPAYVNGQVVGVAHRLSPPGFVCGGPTAYTDVTGLTGWITAGINGPTCQDFWLKLSPVNRPPGWRTPPGEEDSRLPLLQSDEQ